MDHAIVMAGGSGTRFWPESRARRSKQFLDLTGRGPMIVETIRRLAPLFGRERIWVVAGAKDSPHLSPHALGIPRRNVILEPEGRNTAPAVGLASALVARRDPDAVIAACPADHAVADPRAFRAALKKALAVARRSGRFVTLGIPPTHPATGYGYIEKGEPFGRSREGVYEVRRFTEKPEARTAARFLRSGRFCWNSGIFIFASALYADRLARFLPEVHAALADALAAAGRKAFAERLRAAYRRIPSISVDYGILEKERGILVIPAAFGWSDLGTWRSLHEFVGRPGENVAFGNAVLDDCRNVLVRSDGGVIAGVGLRDLVVVRSGDAVLVCRLDRSEDVRKIAEQVRARFPALA